MKKTDKLYVVCLAYRDWAMPIVNSIRKHPRVDRVELCRTDKEYAKCLDGPTGSRAPDIVMYCGWSSMPVARFLEHVPHVGLHCAESDVYSAGTPLQNQILDGLKETKHRIFKVGYPELSLRQWSHESTIDLRGNIEDVLEQLTVTGKLLYNQFLDEWPDVQWKTWPAVDPSRWAKKRCPDDSVITKEQVASMTTEELYNFFRCLEHPYPNGCIEDDVGSLYIERVRFKKK